MRFLMRSVLVDSLNGNEYMYVFTKLSTPAPTSPNSWGYSRPLHRSGERGIIIGVPQAKPMD